MAQSIDVDFEGTVRIIIRDGVDWRTFQDGDLGTKWRGEAYGLATDSEIIDHWVYNAITNGVTSANQLEGWGDLVWDDIQFHIIGFGAT